MFLSELYNRNFQATLLVFKVVTHYISQPATNVWLPVFVIRIYQSNNNDFSVGELKKRERRLFEAHSSCWSHMESRWQACISAGGFLGWQPWDSPSGAVGALVCRECDGWDMASPRERMALCSPPFLTS